MKIHIFVTGRAYPTGDSIPAVLDIPSGSSVSVAIAKLQEVAPDSLPPSCLLAVGGMHLGSLANYQDQELHNGEEITLVAPVAGG